MRTAVLVLVAACLAMVAGAFGAAQIYRPQVDALNAESLALKRQVNELSAQEPPPDATVLESRAARAEADYAALVAETQKLREEVARLTAGQQALESAAAAEPALDDLDAMLDAAPTPGNDEPRRGRRDDWNSPEREAERAARFEEFRARADEYMAVQMENATDPATIERLEAMNIARNNLFDLRNARRNATTDEERAALDAQLDDARDVMESLMREQQNAMLNDVGREYGIKGEALRNFRQQMHEVVDSPFFRFSGPGRGPGRGGGGGGPQ